MYVLSDLCPPTYVTPTMGQGPGFCFLKSHLVQGWPKEDMSGDPGVEWNWQS